MSEIEQIGGNQPQVETPELVNVDKSRVGVYFTAKLYSAASAGLAFVSNVESIAGRDTASAATLRLAGATAVGAAFGAVSGFLLKDRNP